MSEENKVKIRKRNTKLIIAAAVILAFIIFFLPIQESSFGAYSS